MSCRQQNRDASPACLDLSPSALIYVSHFTAKYCVPVSLHHQYEKSGRTMARGKHETSLPWLNVFVKTKNRDELFLSVRWITILPRFVGNVGIFRVFRILKELQTLQLFFVKEYPKQQTAKIVLQAIASKIVCSPYKS